MDYGCDGKVLCAVARGIDTNTFRTSFYHKFPPGRPSSFLHPVLPSRHRPLQLIPYSSLSLSFSHAHAHVSALVHLSDINSSWAPGAFQA